jgi:hypothetical protein
MSAAPLEIVVPAPVEPIRVPAPPSALPSSFIQLAHQARTAAHNEANGIAALEVFAARMDHPVTDRALTDTRIAAERLGEIYYLLRDLAPFEAEVRALLERKRP